MRTRTPRPRRLRGPALVVASLLVATVPVGLSGRADATPHAATTTTTYAANRAAPAAKPAVNERRVIGRSVQGRPITAYRLGDPGGPGVTTVVALSTMHGNEPDTQHLLHALVDGDPVIGVELWVLPVYNPDGLAAGTRRNARGVDLNRNFPYRWRDLDGNYESGPRPASEPETRAVMRFLREVRPDRVLSFHQPLNGVDTQTKLPGFARKVARALRLPIRTFDCGSVCHGTMTQWFNHVFPGAALTVEYGAHPSRRLMREVAPDQLLSIFGAVRGDVGAAPYEP